MEAELERRIFGRKEVFPDKRRLQTVLRDAFSSYEELLDLTQDFAQKWKFYGEMIGWQLKVERDGKALLYVTPLENSFRVGLAVRDEERDALLGSQMPSPKKDELRSAVKYAEGYPLRFEIRRQNDMAGLRVALDLLVRTRA